MESGEIKGRTNIALQAAVDYAAALGGGTVRIHAGEYLMYDSLHLRSNISIIGEGSDKTILKKAACSESRLKVTSGYGEDEITISDPEGFETGYGVAVWDDNAECFLCTVGTIIERIAEGTFRLNTAMNADCVVNDNAIAATIYPVISACNSNNIMIKGIGIDGNRKENLKLNGCRGGGIYLFKTHDVIMENCCIENFNGDGISYQNCNDIVIRNSISRRNAGLGIHPGGSGSLRTIIRDCMVSENDSTGLYLCWKVKEGLIEDCEISNNKGFGISTGHRDTDNRIVNNRIYNNEKGGIAFRREDAAHAAHRTLIENNDIVDNGNGSELLGIKISGEVSNVQVKDNRIVNNVASDKSIGVCIEKCAKNIILENNSFLNTKQEIAYYEE